MLHRPALLMLLLAYCSCYLRGYNTHKPQFDPKCVNVKCPPKNQCIFGRCIYSEPVIKNVCPKGCQYGFVCRLSKCVVKKQCLNDNMCTNGEKCVDYNCAKAQSQVKEQDLNNKTKNVPAPSDSCKVVSCTKGYQCTDGKCFKIEVINNNNNANTNIFTQVDEYCKNVICSKDYFCSYGLCVPSHILAPQSIEKDQIKLKEVKNDKNQSEITFYQNPKPQAPKYQVTFNNFATGLSSITSVANSNFLKPQFPNLNPQIFKPKSQKPEIKPQSPKPQQSKPQQSKPQVTKIPQKNESSQPIYKQSCQSMKCFSGEYCVNDQCILSIPKTQKSCLNINCPKPQQCMQGQCIITILSSNDNFYIQKYQSSSCIIKCGNGLVCRLDQCVKKDVCAADKQCNLGRCLNNNCVNQQIINKYRKKQKETN